MADDSKPTWYKGSRFYRLGGHALYIAASFVYLTMAFHPEFVTEAFGVFGGIGAIILGGGTWRNLKAQDVEKVKNGSG